MSPLYLEPRAVVEESVIVATVNWISDLILGPFGTAIAIIAIASIGVAMSMGYASPRAWVRVIAGCFILFGAPAIAQGLITLTYRERTAMPPTMASPFPPGPIVPPPPPTLDTDPYAGASVPM